MYVIYQFITHVEHCTIQTYIHEHTHTHSQIYRQLLCVSIYLFLLAYYSLTVHLIPEQTHNAP